MKIKLQYKNSHKGATNVWFHIYVKYARLLLFEFFLWLGISTGNKDRWWERPW